MASAPAVPAAKPRTAPLLLLPLLALALFLLFAVRHELPSLGAERHRRPAPAPAAATPASDSPPEPPTRKNATRELPAPENDKEEGLDPLDPEEEEEEEADSLSSALEDSDIDSGASGVSDTTVTLSSSSAKRFCFVYDRPPRTGSTTVARALKACLRSRGFVQPLAESRWVRTLLVGRMLGLDGPRIGLLSKHMYMSGGDVRAIREGCAQVLYVTSCKPMRERLWSAAKYRFSDGNGNFSLSEAEKENARRIVARDAKTEPFLEAYPYLGEDEKALRTPVGEQMVADYVVRAEFMNEDLGGLLRALQCGAQFESKNVHKASEEDATFLRSLPLGMGDETFRRLDRLARERNAEGLRKAAAFG